MSLRNQCFLVMLATLVGFAVVGKLSRNMKESDVPKPNTRTQSSVLAADGSLWYSARKILPTVFLPIQSKNPKGLGTGKLLVASRDLGDPHFAETVILLIQYDTQGVVGLILNRRTDIPLSRVLEGLKAAKDRSDSVYLGGPVEIPAVFVLFQSPAQIEGAKHILGGVYLISAKTLLEQTISTRPDSSVFHVYLGYAGWTKDQLQKEVELGAWFIFPADAGTVFNSDPDSLWLEMIRKTELKLAGSEPAGRNREAPASQFGDVSYTR
jgi:putative AlgH/UPF0301 family transcriptional regulator